MPDHLPPISVVVIGRNEGPRLVRCLESVKASDYPSDQIELIYVDTSSTDGSCEAAEELGAEIIALHPEYPSAACARNAGIREANCQLIQFLDGDTILDHSWLKKAVRAFEDPTVACAFGRVEELRPDASVYMRVAAFDWHVAPGKAEYCGGNAMFRRDILEMVGGFDESLIAGEEPELCHRIRRRGLTIWCCDAPMIQHDLNITSFGQYWRRGVRSGWGYLVVAVTCNAGRGRLWAWKNVVNTLEISSWIFLLAFGITLRVWLAFLALLLLVLVRTLWIAVRIRHRANGWWSSVFYGLHCQFLRIPVFVGQLRGIWHIVRRRPSRLIEYKGV